MTDRNEKFEESFQKASEALTRMSHDSDSPSRPGFKEALKQRILDARQQPAMSAFSWIKAIPPKLTAGGTIALVAVVILMLVLNPFSSSIPVVYAQNNFTLVAEEEDSLGVDPETSFILESREPLDLNFVKEYLRSDTNRSFEIERIDEFRARIVFKEKLSSGQLVRFLLPTQAEQSDGTLKDRPYAWAFQVKTQFHVLHSIPGNETANVPLDAGIEIVFSHENVDPVDFERAFSIEPALTGHVEKNRRSLVFVPDKLEPSTVYRVTIDEDLHPANSSESLGEDYVFRFETDDALQRGSDMRFLKTFLTTIPNEFAQFQMSFDYSNRIPDETSAFTVYRFPNFESFKSSFEQSIVDAWRDTRPLSSYVSVDTLSSVGTFKPNVIESGYYPVYQVPFELEEGYYGILVEWQGQQAFAFLQSTTVSATLVEAEGTSLVWVHDTSTKLAVNGAQVKTDSVSANTNQEGIARITLPETFEALEVRSGNHVLLLPSTDGSYLYEGFGGWWGNRTSVDEDYIGYVYSDRPVYKQGDTVHLWGFLSHRDKQPLPSEVTVRMTTSVYGYAYGGKYQDVEYVRVPVSISGNGIFSVNFKLPDAATGYYRIGLHLGDKEVLSRSIQLQEYRKPVYFMELDVTEKAVIEGDSVHYRVATKYFDGTPVVGKTIVVSAGSSSQTITLDETGVANGTIPVSGGYYAYGFVRAELDEPGFEPIGATEYLTVYPSAIHINGELTIENGSGTVAIETKTVHITNGDDRSEDLKTIRPGTSVNVQVIESYYEKISEGTSYDFIRKIVRENYQYVHRERTVDQQTIVTDQSGKGTFSFAAPNTESWYRVELSSIDDQGRKVLTTAYPKWTGNLGGFRYDSYDSTLHLAIKNREEDGSEKTQFLEGEQVQIEVQQYGERFQMVQNGSFLFVQGQRGIQEYKTVNTPEYAFPFESRDIPNVYLYGVLFTGEGYVIVSSDAYWTSGKFVGFKTESRKLQVEIETDAAQYRPGGEVDVNVFVKDVEGKPVESSVNVSVVDEAFFALYPDTPDPIGSLYHSLSSGIHDIISSHETKVMALGAEGGGGGDGEVRSNFVDTAAFMNLTTGRNGQGNARLKLPDNVTSWRLTVHALDDQHLQAGVNTKKISATLPFFINAAIQPTYLTEDQPEIIVTAQGTGVRLDDTIQYQISVKDTEIGFSTQSTVGQRVSLPLPNLPEGEQTILIEAKTGDKKDAISQVVRVVRSRLTIPVVEEKSLDASATLVGSDAGLTWVTFLDGNQGKFFGDLRRLSWRYGDRADESVVRVLATQLMNELFGASEFVPDMDAANYQSSDGGIRLLSHADPDPILSAKIGMLGETPFDEERLSAYLLDRLYATQEDRQLSPEEAAWAYVGLAGLDTPILSELKRFAQQPLSEEARVAVAIAQLLSGDAEGARAIYEPMMKGAKREIGYVWVEREIPETAKELNAALFLLASGLNEIQDRDGLKVYLDREAKGETLVLLETLSGLKQSFRFLKPGESEVTFTLRDETKSVSLEKGAHLTLAVNKDELRSLNARATKGDVSVITSYQRPIASLPETYNKIRVQRKYLGAGNPDSPVFKANDLILVELTYTVDPSLPGEYFQITDSIPSGLTPVTQRGGSEEYNTCITYPETDTDQTLSFFVYSGWNYSYCPPNTIRYYARVMNTGTFKAEPAAIRAVKIPSLVNYSNAQTVQITP